MAFDESKTATLHRMVMDDHVCPYGLKAKDLLERNRFIVDDNWLESREQTDAFKEKHGVETTPQVFITGDRIGGYDALRAHFGKTIKGNDETSYQPVLAIFAMAFLMGLAISWESLGTIVTLQAFEWFIAVAMCLLAVQKLQDVESFSTMFLNYDLLARKWVPYGYVYPFAEGFAGILMIAGALIWIAAPVAIFIGTIGTASVIKAVYVDKRELKCACVGGNSNVPLGFISLTENVMMVTIGLWMLLG